MKKGPLLLVALLLGGSLLWSFGAFRRSLWTDEFHSLHHVREPGWPEFFQSVKTDNHPPLSFLAERLSVGAFGESELALRLPSIAVGVAFLFLVWQLAGALGSAGRARAGLVALFSSFSYVIFSEARMYGWLALSVCGLTLAVLRGLECASGPRGGLSRLPWAVTLWTALGLHSHYYFIHYLFVLGLCVVWIAATRPPLRGAVLRGLAPLLAGVLLWVPWGVFGFLGQLSQDFPPGGHESGFLALAQGIYHLFFMNSGFAGPWFGRFVALPTAAVGLALALLGISYLRRNEPSKAPSEGQKAPSWLLVGAMAFAVPVWACLASELFDRASFGWRYIAGSIGPLAVLVAAGFEALGALNPSRTVWKCLKSAILTLFYAGLGAGVLVNLLGGEREDYRAAVAHILAEARPGDAVVVKPLWDPDPKGSPTGWHYYARRLSQPGQVTPEVLFQEHLRSAKEHQRVWIFQRDPYSAFAIRALRKRFAEEESQILGLDVTLYLFSSNKAQ